MDHLLTRAYDHAIAAMEDLDFAKSLRPQDIVQIVRIYIEANSKLSPAETPVEGSSVSDWSEEDDSEFDRILAEIVAEDERRDLEIRADQEGRLDKESVEDSADRKDELD
jgi:hypothetical protein